MNLPGVSLMVRERHQIGPLATYCKPQHRRDVPAGLYLVGVDGPDKAGFTGLDVAQQDRVAVVVTHLVCARGVLLTVRSKRHWYIGAQGEVGLSKGGGRSE